MTLHSSVLIYLDEIILYILILVKFFILMLFLDFYILPLINHTEILKFFTVIYICFTLSAYLDFIQLDNSNWYLRAQLRYLLFLEVFSAPV